MFLFYPHQYLRLLDTFDAKINEKQTPDLRFPL